MELISSNQPSDNVTILRRDIGIIIDKIKQIIKDNYSENKIVKIEVPFPTIHSIRKINGCEQIQSISKVKGIDIIGDCKELKVYYEEPN